MISEQWYKDKYSECMRKWETTGLRYWYNEAMNYKTQFKTDVRKFLTE